MNKTIKKLSVRLYGKEVGILTDISGKMRFKYNSDAKTPLSLSLPIIEQVYSEKDCKGYFGGLLPESPDTRRIIAMQNKINPNNDFALLAAIGRDCAGAVSFHEIGEPEKDEHSLLVEGDNITIDELEENIKNLPKKPLSLGRRLSLAGAQEKTAVTVINGKICLAKNSSPTTHILKPAIRAFEQSVANEYICMQAAKMCGLLVPDVQILMANDTEFFLIERFDRQINGEKIIRLQQEDFTQALGIWTDNKYSVTFKDCEKVLSQLRYPAASKNQFVYHAIFNYLIGNCDAHGKNFSILYKQNGDIFLSPAYDILCTRVYEGLDSVMAMKIGNAKFIDEVREKDWNLFAKQLGVNPLAVRDTLWDLTNQLPIALDGVVKELDIEIGYKILNYVNNSCSRAKPDMGF